MESEIGGPWREVGLCIEIKYLIPAIGVCWYILGWYVLRATVPGMERKNFCSLSV